MPFLKFFLLLLFAQTLHLGAMAFVGTKVGGTIKLVRLGFGPELLRFIVFGFDVGFGPLPLGGYVQFWQTTDEQHPPPGTLLFDELPGYRRAAAQLAGPFCLFVVACIGTLSFAWAPVYSGWVDYLGAVLAPRTRGPMVLGEAVVAIRTLPALRLLGLLCAKLAAWNILPIPSLNGGSAILAMCLPNDAGGTRVATGITVFGSLVLLAAGISLMIAVWTYLWL